MGIKDKMKTYNFWISLVSALLLVARILGTKYGFTIDSGLVMDVTTAMCSVFVILGIISAPQKVVTKYQTEYQTVTKDAEKTDNITDGSIKEVVEQEEFAEQNVTEPQMAEPASGAENPCEIEMAGAEDEASFLEESNTPIIEEQKNGNIETAKQNQESQNSEKTDAPIGNLEEMDKEALIKVILSLENK